MAACSPACWSSFLISPAGSRTPPGTTAPQVSFTSQLASGPLPLPLISRIKPCGSSHPHTIRWLLLAEFDVVGSAADVPASSAGSLQGGGASASGIATATMTAHPTKQL